MDPKPLCSAFILIQVEGWSSGWDPHGWRVFFWQNLDINDISTIYMYMYEVSLYIYHICI